MILAFRKLARKYHPDKIIDPIQKQNAQKQMSQINEAYDKVKKSRNIN